MTTWTFHPDCPESVRETFRTLDDVFQATGKEITRDQSSTLTYATVDGTGYYIKRYIRAGKGVRRWIGRSRIRGEWESIQRFEQWGLPTARALAFGLEKRGLLFKRGAVITPELLKTQDLAELTIRKAPRLKNFSWVKSVSGQLAHAVRTMHHNRFGHGDLKWRNILVTSDEDPQIYLIDCPGGKRWIPPFLQYRKNKDIACLDEYGEQVLSRSQRMRFYLNYLQQDRLTPKDKRNLRHILRFFRGRE